MATAQDYKYVEVEESNPEKALSVLQDEAELGYFPVAVLEDNRRNGVTTFVMSQGQKTIKAHHPDVHNVYLKKEGVTSDENLILIDIDDINNYPHNGGTFACLQHVVLETNVSSSFEYEVAIGFLSEVGSSNGKFNEALSVYSSSNEATTRKHSMAFGTVGGALHPDRYISSEIIQSSEYASSNQLASVLDPATADVSPNNGDVVVKIDNNSGNPIRVEVVMSYLVV